MYHTTAEDFNPSGAFTETAAFTATLEAGYVYLSTWLSEWEMMGSEFGFCLRSEELLGKFLKSSLQIRKCNILINNQTFDLMEGRRMCSIYFIRTEHTSRCDHTDRKLAFFHSTCLYRGGLGT